MIVLVTGGAGYVGSHTAKCMSRTGFLPVVYDNLSRGHPWAVQWGPLEVGDLLDQNRLEEVLRRHRVEAVVHFAALAYVGESMQAPELYFRNNVEGTLSLLNAMRNTGVRQLVFSSSCAVYGSPERIPIEERSPQAPNNPYGESKLFAEKMLRWEGECHGLRWVALRYFNAAGCDPEGEIGELHQPETHLIPSLIEARLGLREACPIFGDDYPTPDGSCIRDYVHVSDLAVAHVSALKYLSYRRENVALNLGTGAGYSVKTLVAKLEEITGGIVPIRQEPRRPGDPPCLVASPNLARETISWNPNYSSLETILATAYSWQQRRINASQLAR